jgi:hypothetical protein
VFIRTHQDLQNKLGRHFSIVPGMIATVDIKTGEKSIVLFNQTVNPKSALRALNPEDWGWWGLVTKSVILVLTHWG